MKELTFMSTILLSIASSCSSEDVQDKKLLKCIPNKVFIYDHNICFCNDEGTEIKCKRKMYSTLTPQLHGIQLQNITKDCDPGSLFKIPCKECVCQESGKYASCLLTDCPKEELILETPENCTSGAVFNEHCNGCICGTDKKAACTKLNCKVIGWSKDELQCVPSSIFMVKCNECDCAKDGKAMSCEKMGCSSLSFYHEHVLNVTMTCEKNSSFHYNCHKCHCSDNGNYAMCSGMPCPHAYDFNEVQDTIEKCNPGMIFSSDCNVCICNDKGKGICTTFSCDTTYRFKYVKNLNFLLPEI